MAAQIYNNFLSVLFEKYPEKLCFKDTEEILKHLSCVNEYTVPGLALIRNVNHAAKDEEQKQYLSQVVEMLRKNFEKCNYKDLQNI